MEDLLKQADTEHDKLLIEIAYRKGKMDGRSEVFEMVSNSLNPKTCADCKNYVCDMRFDNGEERPWWYCDKGRFVATNDSGACECFEEKTE